MTSTSLRRLSLAFFGLTLVTGGAGCGVLLGLDDFTEGQGTGSGGGGSGTTASSSSTGGAGGAGSSTSGAGGMGGMPMPCTPKETKACYSGAAGTEGQGLCKGGTQTCKDDGMGFGACVGEVVPTLENCAAPQDEDCSGSASKCTGMFQWGNRFWNATSDQTASSAAIDSQGNTLVSGSINGAVNFGGGAITGGIFVARFDPSGKHLFSKAFGGAGSNSGLVLVDSSDNMVLTGTFSGAISFGGGQLDNPGTSNVFLARLAPDGSHLFSKTLGSGAIKVFKSVVDATGNTLITGIVLGTASFGGTTIGTSQHYSAFVAKFDKVGALVYSLGFGGTGSSGAQAQGIGVDAAGNAVVAAGFIGTVDFGGIPLTAPSLMLAVVKIDPAGKVVYAKPFGPGIVGGLIDAGMSVAMPGSFDIAVDGPGNVVLAGGFTGTVGFGGPTLSNGGGGDVFVAKLDPLGGHLWSQSFGGAGDQYATHP